MFPNFHFLQSDMGFAVKCFSKSLILIPILKIENYSELLMGVILRKSLVDNDKKKTKMCLEVMF